MTIKARKSMFKASHIVWVLCGALRLAYSLDTSRRGQSQGLNPFDNSQECNALRCAIVDMAEAFPCVKEYCPGIISEVPSLPPVTPTTKPPSSSESTPPPANNPPSGQTTAPPNKPPTPPPIPGEVPEEAPKPPGVPTTTTAAPSTSTPRPEEVEEPPKPPVEETTTPAPPQPPSTSTTTSSPPSAEGNAVGLGSYIPSWFVYKKHYMGVEKINVFNEPVSPESASAEYVFFASDMKNLAPKLTHLYYAFWSLSEDCIIDDSDADASWYGKSGGASWIPIPKSGCKGLMNDMMSLKAEFSHLKLMVSVGGWTYSRYFSKCTSTAENREIMWKSFSYRMREIDSNWGSAGAIWDGVDFDWEFPEAKGLYSDFSPSDWNNYVKLAEEFRSRAKSEGRNRMIISSAVGVGETLQELLKKPVVAKAFCDSMDNVNLMEYDIHGKWDPTTGHLAPFCKDPRPGNPSQPVTVKDTVEGLINAGCSAQKIYLGIPNYGHAWTKIEPGLNSDGLFVSASDASFVGYSTFSDSDSALVPQGVISHWDRVLSFGKGEFKEHSYSCPEDRGVVVPIKHGYSAKHKAFVSYDDEEVVSKKSEWARKAGLGGVFFWDAQNDKYGNLLTAARGGWGNLPEHPATGTAKCFDSSKPNYNIDPSTGAEKVVNLRKTNHQIVVQGTVTSCFTAKESAEKACPGKKVKCTGGARSTEQDKLIDLCGYDWTGTPLVLWASDLLWFACEGEPEFQG